ncbi:MAG: hypothetical protein N2171_06680 [Clostridia bacterium]|nr:hypothetical protein [Clostridia bacterium]
MDKRIHIFTGHFGSGKTEVALNFAVKQAKSQKKIAVLDLDIVNPYFRTKDARKLLDSLGICTIVSDFAGSNVDVPVIPAEVLSVFDDKSIMAVFDVGGDDDGAYALGRYKRRFDEEGYEMHFVVNTKRPLTQTSEDIVEFIDLIERASRLRVTDIVNNTNIGKETDESVLLSGYEEIVKAAQKKQIPISMHSGTEKALACLNDEQRRASLVMNIYLKMPWEDIGLI